GSAGYQQAFEQHVAAKLASMPGLNGTYNDDFPVDPRPIWAGYNCASPGSWPAKYPSRAAWEAAMVSFAQNVGAYLHARGYYLVGTNVGRRDFASGYVIVNPTSAAVTVGGVSIPSGDAVLHQN